MKLLSDFVHEVFGPNGLLAHELTEFESRPDQLAMARHVASALEDSGTLLAEAGTGIGKSLAYLIPSAYWALVNDEAIIVSTYTRALQEQLVLKDVPIVMSIMEAAFPQRRLKAVSLKGRSNYLCRERWIAESSRRNPDLEIAAFVTRIRPWVEETSTGDKAELDLSERDDRLFQRLSASVENCSNVVCRMKQGQKCFFAKARVAAHRSDIVVVNHALLFSDQGSGGALLPESARLIVDEAHHLEATATRQFSNRLTAESFNRHIESLVELKGTSAGGMLPSAIGLLANAGAFSSSASSSSDALNKIRSAIDDGDRAARSVSELFDHLKTTAADFAAPGSNESVLRIQPSSRRQPRWSDVEIAADQLLTCIRKLESHCHWLIKALSAAINDRIVGEPAESALAAATAWIDVNGEMSRNLESSLLEPEENGVYWIEKLPNADGVAFCAAPLRVGEWIAASVFAERETIVLTSATLTVGDRFTLFRQQAGVDEAFEFVAPSPFDYRNSALIYLASDIAEPSHPNYQKEVDEAIFRVASALGGKTLALFTSHRHLRDAAAALREPLALQGIELLAQGIDAPPQELAERLRGGGPVVVLGAASMWEGIDIPGPGLSALIVVRLPFDVPSDPLFQARSELYLAPFYEYSVPRAVLRFRQGFGRLIRSASDRGVCVVLDRRIITKAYGRTFLDALPGCQIERGPISQIGASALNWVRRDTERL